MNAAAFVHKLFSQLWFKFTVKMNLQVQERKTNAWKDCFETFHSYFLKLLKFIESCDCIYSCFFENGSFRSLLLSDGGFSAWKLRLYPFQAIFWIKLGYSRAFVAHEAFADLNKSLRVSLYSNLRTFSGLKVGLWKSKSTDWATEVLKVWFQQHF